MYLDSLVANPSLATKNQNSLRLPPLSFLKFDVDGACSEVNGQSSIGGILRDCYGGILLKFSSSIPLTSEFLAIQFAANIFSSSGLSRNSRLIVEIDCKVAVEWLLNPSLANPMIAPWSNVLLSLF
ncbi:hypothetical protein V6N13_034608 [Hibiscus sabdariffa]